MKLLLKIIDNNGFVVSMPLAEFQFNDIGLAMIILYKERKVVEARMWLFSLIENLTLHFSLDYNVLPLNNEIKDIPNCILTSTKELELGTIISILLEFTYIFDASESYHILTNWIMSESVAKLIDSNTIKPAKLIDGSTIKEILLPDEQFELELYDKELLHLAEYQINFPGIWEVDKQRYHQRINKITRNYSFNQRAHILILLSSIYKDRILQDIWRCFVVNTMPRISQIT